MKKRKILALIMSVVLSVSAPTLFVKADDAATKSEVIENGTLTGEAGGTGSVWTYDYATETLTFTGREIYHYRCDELADQVKHIVFQEGVEKIWGDSSGTKFTNVETITLPSTLNIFSAAMEKDSRKLLSITIPEGNSSYVSVDGNLYSKYNGKINGLRQYAVGKEDKTFVLPEGVTQLSAGAFSGAEYLEEVVLPESCIQTWLPYTDCNVSKVTIKNPDCNLVIDGDTDGLTLCSYTYSEVELKCTETGISFEPLEVEPAAKITVARMPEKTTYVSGRVFDPYGLELDVEYKDGTTARVKSGYTIAETDVHTVGKQNVTVEYGGVSTTFEIEVIDIPEPDILTLDSPVWTGVYEESNNTTTPYDMYRDFYFIPKITGVYRFYSTGTQDPSGIIMDMNENIIAENKDAGYDSNGKYNNNFSIEQELEKGKVYILRASLDMAGEYSKFFVCVSLIQTTEECEHVYGEPVKVVEPTCSSEGYTLYKCTICGETKKSDYTAMISHEFTVETVVKEPTCTENGYTIYKCKNCNTAIMEAVQEALGHDYVETVIAPTSIEYGYTLHECSRCNQSFKTNWIEPIAVEEIVSSKSEETTVQETEKQTIAVEKLTKPKVKAKRSDKKVKLRLRSSNKGVRYQIYVKKNGIYKKIKTTKKSSYIFKHAKKCYIKVRTVKYSGKYKIYSKFKKVKI